MKYLDRSRSNRIPSLGWKKPPPPCAKPGAVTLEYSCSMEGLGSPSRPRNENNQRLIRHCDRPEVDTNHPGLVGGSHGLHVGGRPPRFVEIVLPPEFWSCAKAVPWRETAASQV